MANVPYPLTSRDLEELRTKIWELFRTLYEEKIGGADLGDVFAIVGDVLTLVLSSTGGLTKVSNELACLLDSEGGLDSSADGLTIKLADGSLELSESGLAIAGYLGTTPIIFGDGLTENDWRLIKVGDDFKLQVLKSSVWTDTSIWLGADY